MLVVASLLLLGLIGYFVPRKKLKRYFLICAGLISLMFAFYDPPKADDLYRYYGLFDIVNGMSLKDYVNSRFKTTDWLYGYMLNDYMQNSKTFMVILFIISKTGIKALLPIFFSFLTYVPLINMICEVADDHNYRKQTLCTMFLVVLACVDVRMLTMLRNMSAYAWFAYLLYIDLVKQEKRFLCFIGYFVLCELHMACVVMFAIRLIMLITKKRLRYVIMTVMISAFAFTEQLAALVNVLLGRIEFFKRLAQRMIDYNIGRINYNSNGAIFFVGSLLVCLACYWLTRNYVENKKKYEMFGAMFVYEFAYTIGSIRQYDVLTRNCQLMVMLGVPFLMAVINGFYLKDGIMIVQIRKNKASTSVLLPAMVWALVAFSFLFYGLFSYIPLQAGLRIM